MGIQKQIFDNHGRPVNYLRLAVTDRCNLRCFYCMPEEGIKYLPKSALLSYEEMERLIRIMAGMGIKKVRITGGEPFVRKDLIKFLWNVSEIEGIEKIHITTNGVLTAPFIPELKKIGIASVNLSLDSLNKERFHHITRRDELDQVMESFHLFLEHGIPLKINAVVMDGKNTEDIIPMVKLAENYPVSVRFIEEMPFNGWGASTPTLHWTYKRIMEEVNNTFPDIKKIADPDNSTAYHYKVPGHKGDIGVIAAFSRTFCGTCNRIRVTAQGTLKTCLYDDGVLDIRQLMRKGATDEQVENELLKAFSNRAKDGFEAENNRKGHAPITESMSTIGG